MAGYRYIRSELTLWTVGFHDGDGRWIPESDHDSTEEAAARVRYLNGGAPEPAAPAPTRTVPATLTAEGIARSAQALRILERLLHEVFSAVQDAATDLEALAPDEEEVVEVETDPDAFTPPAGARGWRPEGISPACAAGSCAGCRMGACEHTCHTT